MIFFGSYGYGYKEFLFSPAGASGGSGSLYWLDPVADLASLPLIDPIGSARYVISEAEVYTWNGVSWTPVGSTSGDIVYAGSAPVSGLFNGKLWMNTTTSTLYAYDSTRLKWLGIEELTVAGSRAANSVSNIFLRGLDSAPMNLVTVEAPYDMTIIRLQATGRESVVQTWVAEVRINNGLVPVAVLNVTAADGAVDDTLNVDINAGDRIQLYLNGSLIQYPRIDVFLKRRG